MSNSGERTEQPTAQRLREARERGEVAKSADLAHAASLAAALLLCLAYVPTAAARLAGIARRCLEASRFGVGDKSELQAVLADALTQVFPVLLPFLVLPAVVAGLGLFAQIGPLFVTKPLSLAPERLSPAAGAKQLFSFRSVVELLKGLFISAAMSAIAILVLRRYGGDLLRLPTADARAAPHLLQRMFASFAAYALLAGLIVAAADYLYQRWQFVKDKRMSKSDVKREHKDNEGDPHLKHARRQRWQELQQHRMFDAVRQKADFIVRNPTHLVCAISYGPAAPGEPPRLVGKGKGWVAQRLREIARHERIPEFRNVPLARALYTLDLDEHIPPELYAAVIEVLNWVEQQARARGQTVHWRKSTATDATSPREIRSQGSRPAGRGVRKRREAHDDDPERD